MHNESNKGVIIKRVGIIAMIVIAIVAVGFGFAMLFRTISKTAVPGPASNDASSTTGEASAPNAASIVKSYVSLGTIRALSDNHYQEQTGASYAASISYKADDQDYQASIPTDSHALFSAKAGYVKDDSKAIASQTASFMKSKGFAETSTSKQAAKGTPAYTTYVNSGTVCQLTSSPGSAPAFYAFACADKAAVDNEYATIARLLTIYQSSHQLDDFTAAIRTSARDGNKSMSIIRLTSAHAHPALLFAAVDDKWEYLGNLSGDSAKDSNGKYTLSSSTKAAIENPKYGSFLINQLEK